jgi:hypothetical protein
MWINKLRISVFAVSSLLMTEIGFSQAVQIRVEAACTTPLSEKEKLTIKRITLTDEKLITQIKEIIHEKQNDSVFLKRGYIRVDYVHYGYKNEAVVRAYNIKPEYQHADDVTNDRLFPIYYTYVENRLVTIYDSGIQNSICYQIATKSKMRYQRILEPYLSKAIWIELPKSDGSGTKKAKFRPNSLIQIHGGRTLYIFDDGTSTVEKK